MARLAFSFVLLWCTASFAPPVEILWRPSLLSNQAILDHFGVKHPTQLTEAQHQFWNRLAITSGDAIGHIAVRIPTPDGPKVFGWHPVSPSELPEGHPMRDKKPSQLVEWLMIQDGAGRFPSVPGRLREDTAWAERGVGDGPDYTRAIPIEVSDAQLAQIKKNLLRLKSDSWNYQLVADRHPILNTRSFQGRNANCIAAVGEVFRGTGVSLDFLPEDSAMSSLYKSAQSRSTEWRSVCAAVLAF